MRKFLITLLVVGIFAALLVLAGTAQNQGCLPWKTPITVGGNGPFSEDRGDKLCK